MPSPYSPPSLIAEAPYTSEPVLRRAEAPSYRRPIRVVAVDDHAAIRDALADTVESQVDMELCGTASNVQQTIELIQTFRPDVAVVDINIGDEHGLDLVRCLQSEYPDLKVIVFSMYDRSLYGEAALSAGAGGYVMKSESTQSVISAIRTAVRGPAAVGRQASVQRAPSNGPEQGSSNTVTG
jgi:DNA-binding NarL/FixJ family response regulator